MVSLTTARDTSPQNTRYYPTVMWHFHPLMKGWDPQSVTDSDAFMRSSLVKFPSPKLGRLCLWSLSEPAPSACSKLSCFHFWWCPPTERHGKHKTSTTCQKKGGGGVVGICLRVLTSFGCESTTFWQMLCSCVMSLTRPKFFSWMICWAVLPDDLHISWKTWEHGRNREYWGHDQNVNKHELSRFEWQTGGIIARSVQLTDLLGNRRRDSARFLKFQQFSQRRGRDRAEIKWRGSVITVYEWDWKIGEMETGRRTEKEWEKSKRTKESISTRELPKCVGLLPAAVYSSGYQTNRIKKAC